MECGDVEMFVSYAEDRADVFRWLRPLVGKSLICHCGNNRHASILGSLVNKLFGPPGYGEYAPQSQPAYVSREAGTGVIPNDTELADSKLGGIYRTGNSPITAPQWPDEWTAMVQSIRDAPGGLEGRAIPLSSSLSSTDAPKIFLGYSLVYGRGWNDHDQFQSP